MAKKQNAIYEPGELNRVRGKLGNIDEQEAKRMAQILGGEVGTEKAAALQPAARKSGSRIRRETAELALPGRQKKRSVRSVDVLGSDEGGGGRLMWQKENDPADDPSSLLKTSYAERVKMDRYAAQANYEIKTAMQAFISALAFVGEPADYVNPRFVVKRMNAYYQKIEQLVTSTRNLFPRNNARRGERLKKTSPFVYSVLDVIRQWNIERINGELSRLQARPREAKASDFTETLKEIYKPLFILDKLHNETHIKGAYKLLYKLIYIENPMEPKEKNQDLIRASLSAFSDIRKNVQYFLYPLLMKLISDRWFPYEQLFVSRWRRYKAFLGVNDSDQIQPAEFSPDQVENGKLEAVQQDILQEQQAAANPKGEGAEDPDDPKVIERKAKEAAAEAERKVLRHSLGVLETLFPQAGWDRLPEYPDLYPYFVNTYELRRGYELIAPADPMQQTAVLMHILENLCVALRYVTFGSVTGSDGKPANVNECIGSIIVNWRQYIDDSFSKEYLPRLSEYCRLLENSAESRTSPYARRTYNELRWIKRLYFLPYYKFESLGPPPFQKQDIAAVYAEIRTLRKYLTLVAAGIEQGNRAGSAGAKAKCEGIENPWQTYNFEIPNPVSKRMDALLAPAKRNNAALIFFALSAAAVLDNMVNNENSWAYTDRPGTLFRSVNDEGSVPLFGVDKKLDADQIFKDTLNKRKVTSEK